MEKGASERNDRERLVYERLRDEIVSGALMPGQKLSQSTLAKQLGVSRTPIRVALQRLRSDGLIRSAPDISKPIVSEMSADELEILYQTLGVLEGLAARLVARQISAYQTAVLKAALEEEQKLASEGSADGALDQLASIHRLIVDFLKSPALAAAIAAIRLPLDRYRRMFLRSKGFDPKSTQYHVKIVDAIVAGDGILAERLMIEHMSESFSDAIGHLRQNNRLDFTPRPERRER